jgi:hypothetical protein
MTSMKLLSAGPIATAMLATPAMAREHYAAKRHTAENANAPVTGLQEPSTIYKRGVTY